MTMTDERLAELDAVYTKPLHINFSPEWVKAIGDARRDIHNVYPDLRAHIEAQAATIARQAEALREAQGWFAEYAVMHLDKNTPEGVAKAASNARKAEYCAAALTGAA